jgi:uncharacterized membrane protein
MRRMHVADVALGLVIVAFVATFAVLAVRRHAALATNGMDLGNVNQALWNTAQGDFLAFTNMAPVQNRLALHVEPILLLLVPLYWLGLGGPVALLVIQAAVVGLGALPLYWLAREHLTPWPPLHQMERGTRSPLATGWRGGLGGEVFLALVFPVAYLLLPALEAAVMYDFHAVTLAPTCLLFAFYYLLRGRALRFALFAVLAMACKEDVALTVAMLGLYVLVAGRLGGGHRVRWPAGLAALTGGLAWFAIALFVVQPAFSPTGGNVQAVRYAWLGDGVAGIVDTLLWRPELIWNHVWHQADLPGYLAGLLVPTAFLGILSPLTWLPALPSLVINLLSDDPFTWRLEAFHYAAPIAPFAVISALFGAQALVRLVARRWAGAIQGVEIAVAVVLLVTALIYHWGRGFSPLARPFHAWPVSAHARLAESVFRQVPDSAALFAQSNLNPHVSARRELYQSPAVLTGLLEGNETTAGVLPAPEFVLLDVATLVNQDDFQTRVVGGLLERGFQPMVADDGFLLLRTTAGGASLSRDGLPDGFYNFARAGDAVPTYLLNVDFDATVRLVGLDLAFQRDEEVQPVLTLEALRPLDEDLFVALYLMDEWGVLRGATLVDQPALVWYPTHRWQPGERVRVTFNTLPWYTRTLPAYRLAVGVLRGRDPWQPAARLTPQPPPDSPYAIRLPAGGSLLELARLRQDVFGMPQGGPTERQFAVPRALRGIQASFGDQIRLLGYDVRPVQCDDTGRPGGSGCWLGVVLHWQARSAPTLDYTVFVHVVDQPGTADSGRIRAQRDAPPDDGAYPTRRWLPGEVVEDAVRVELPVVIPAGPYDLVLGLYDPATGQRLPVLDAAGQAIDDKVMLSGAMSAPTVR